VLIGIINSKIKDARLIKLIWKFLKAGYMEDWKYNSTHSGCPQGGIVSPLLSNIYLNELDKFAEKAAKEFYKPRDREDTVEYKKIDGMIYRTVKSLKTANGQNKTELLKRVKFLKSELRKTPSTSQTDKVIKYIRYADDFIIGIKGDKTDCERIKQQFSEFIRDKLKMELSEEKTLITHSNHYARFLGYDVRVRRDQTVKSIGKRIKRTLNYTVELNVPFTDKIMPFLFDKGIIKQTHDGKIEHIARKYLYRCTNLEIIDTYNSELRGICNYYGIASNFAGLHYFAYLMEYSCLKTLAGKHKSTSKKIRAKFPADNGAWGIPYETATGQKCRTIAKYSDCKDTDSFSDVIVKYAVIHAGKRTILEKRLSAQVCELCGKTNTPLAMHHVNKVKNLKGKKHWEIVMIAKRRKTLAVCKGCHHKIHNP